MADLEQDVVHLARLAREGKVDEVSLLSGRILRAIAKRRPDLADAVRQELAQYGKAPVRTAPASLPVDLDSRLELLRVEHSPVIASQPIWSDAIEAELLAVVAEREMISQLTEAGISPTRSLLLTGPPGVGKTLAARWLAAKLRRPLLTLDLAAVMSSFLGRTGNNIRVVLDYARSIPSVLLLDEFDAIAKRRDDLTEVGELKRLVTVLLQEIEQWPAFGLLVAATNHPDLLDPAVWRRFNRVLAFQAPSVAQIEAQVRALLEDQELESGLISQLAAVLAGSSNSDVARTVETVRRESIVQQSPLEVILVKFISRTASVLPLPSKLQFASELARCGESQRAISALTGLSRDTIRKHAITASVQKSRPGRQQTSI